jgi:hypothetical protein
VCMPRVASVTVDSSPGDSPADSPGEMICLAGGRVIAHTGGGLLQSAPMIITCGN